MQASCLSVFPVFSVFPLLPSLSLSVHRNTCGHMILFWLILSGRKHIRCNLICLTLFNPLFVCLVFLNDTVLAACFCTSVTLFASPFIIAICRRKSPRLMAILGGLVTALGCLFTSFATQFHQLFFAFGIFIGIGIAMIREPSVVMVGQYFKKKREAVEVALMSCYSLGISFMPLFITFCIRFVFFTFDT